MQNNQPTPQEEIIQMDLINNPSYDSDWIAQCAKILSRKDNDITKDQLEKCNALQVTLFNEILESDDKDKAVSTVKTLLNNTDLNTTQMRLYWIGISRGLTENIMERFLNPSIQYAKSNYVIQALIDGYTGITEYMDYSAAQIAEIYAGMKDDIDYKKYTNIEYSADFMNFIRHGLCLGIDMTIKTNFCEVNIINEAEDDCN